MLTSDKVVVELVAKMDRFNSDILRAQTLFETNMKKVERGARRTERTVEGSAARMAQGFVKAFAVIGGVQTFRTLLDAGTRIDNALKVAGLAGEELEGVYQRLKQSAMDNAAPLETLVTLYGRVSMVQKELNITQAEMLNFTDKIALALRVGGGSAAESSGALLQLSQAMGAGVVRAEEFNSILEGALPIAQAAAAGLKEAGGSVSELRKLVIDGKLSSEAFFRAIEAGAVMLEGKVANATLTTEQGFTNIGTALVDAMRDFARGSLAAESLGDAFNMMAEKINSVDFEKFGEQAKALLETIGQIRTAMNWIQSAGANFSSFTGLDKVGDALVNNLPGGGDTTIKSYLGGALTITSAKSIENRINQAAGEAVETAQKLTEEELARHFGGKGDRLVKTLETPPVVVPVSISDFDAPSTKGDGKKKGTKERANEYEQLTVRVKEATAALLAETAAQQALNPLIDDHGYTLEKARLEHELLNAAQKAGIAITPELRQEISALAETYALATVEASKLAEEQDRAREQAEKWLGVSRDVTKGLISDLMNGTSAADAFANALRKIGDALIDDVLNSIFQINGAAGGGGILGGIFSLFTGGKGKIPGYAQGTSNHPGGLAWVGEQGRELVNLPKGSQVIPNHRLGSIGGQAGVTVNFNPVIDNRGASPEAVARNAQQLEQLKKELPSIVTASVRKAQKSNVKLGG